MFSFSKRVRSIAVLALMAGTTAAVLTIEGCGSQPGRVKWRHQDPWTGETEGEREYLPSGPTSALPPGWTPGNEQTIDITIDGKRYRIRICVARNLAFPNCIFINTGGCAATEGWQMYCEDTSQQQRGGPPNAEDSTPTVKVDGRNVRLSTKAVIITEPTDCPDEWGSADYDMNTGIVTASFITACREEILPTDLFNVTITGPDGISLPWDLFSVVHNGILPVGSLVEMQGSDQVVAWDCLQFHRPWMTFTSTDGHVVDAGIGFPRGLPPVAIIAIDGQVERTIMVTRPQ